MLPHHHSNRMLASRSGTAQTTTLADPEQRVRASDPNKAQVLELSHVRDMQGLGQEFRFAELGGGGLRGQACRRGAFDVRAQMGGPLSYWPAAPHSNRVPLCGSPIQFWCYGDESFVGAIKAVCAMSKHPATLEVKVFKKAMITAGINAYENHI